MTVRRTPESFRLFGFALAVVCALASEGSPVRADDPALDRAAVEARLEKRRDDLRKLEESVQLERDQLKLQLFDVVVGQQMIVAKARKDFEKASEATAARRLQLKEYLEGTYLRDRATVKGTIKLAQSDLELASDRLRNFEDPNQGNVNPNKKIVAELEKQQAQFEVEQAKMQLEVLEKYTKEKETKMKQAAIDAAAVIEAEKKGILESEQAKEARLRAYAAEWHVRSPEDLVIALIDDAVQKEGQAVAIIAEAQKLEAQIREKPEASEALQRELAGKRNEIVDLMNRAKTQLLEAVNIGEQSKNYRKQLRDSELRLKNERQLLETLEAQLVPPK